MKRFLLFAVCLVLCAGTVFAQIPNVSIYFDATLTETAKNCPAAPMGTVLDSFYVVANNFNMWMNAIEYTIEYPTQIIWVGDRFPDDRLTIGSSPTGVGVSWPLPANSFEAVIIQKALFFWACEDCSPSNKDAPIVVTPYPYQSTVRAVRWPDLFVVPAVGMTSLICSTTPVEQRTWGGIKALYR